jgi:hypothetical protein
MRVSAFLIHAISPLIPEYQSVIKEADFLHLTKMISDRTIRQRIL